MSEPKVNPQEKQAVLNLLLKWHRALAKIDEATERMRLIAAEPGMGIMSVEYERARVVALAVVNEAGGEMADPAFWPDVSDEPGAVLLVDLRQKMDEATKIQLNILRLWGVAAQAFRNGKEDNAPPIGELASLNNDFARTLDEMGMTGAELAMHFGISARELESDEQE